jgi:ribonuclease HI
MAKKNITVYTDGSCFYNGKVGSSGGIGIHFPNSELRDISKVYRNGVCTNQRTELYAILTAIRYINKYIGLNNCKLRIKTDSKYSINCVTNWAIVWKKNGWMTTKKTPVENKKYIELIYGYSNKYGIKYEHVRAHTKKKDPDSIGNDRADCLAKMASRRSIVENKKNKAHVMLIGKKGHA